MTVKRFGLGNTAFPATRRRPGGDNGGGEHRFRGATLSEEDAQDQGACRMAAVEQETGPVNEAAPLYSLEAAAVVAVFGSDEVTGLVPSEAATRIAQYGPNQITSEKPPSVW